MQKLPRVWFEGFWVGCQDKLCVNSDADKTLAYWESRYVKEVVLDSCEKQFKKFPLDMLGFKRVLDRTYQWENELNSQCDF